MAKYTEFYKGRRKRRNYVFIPTAIVLGLITLTLVLFYGMQKYADITKDKGEVKVPLLDNGENTVIDAQGNEVTVFDQVDAQIVFDAPDYSGVEAVAGQGVGPIRAIFVPYTDLNTDKLEEYAGRLRAGNALVLEMKPRQGTLMWSTQSSVAQNYLLNSTAVDNRSLIETFRKNHPDVYLAAQISCCLDELFSTFSTSVTLKTSYGADYRDDSGTWLDAYSTTLRTYVVELCRELYDMGFDEVILADVAHPVLPEPEEGQEQAQLVYTRDMSTTPTAVNAVCGFAVSVADQLSDRPGLLSIYCNAARALVGDADNGQNAVLFMKLYDRVYYPTDKYAYTFNFEDIQSRVTIGEAKYRFVPVVQNYLPDNSDEVSWVLIDVEED